MHTSRRSYRNLSALFSLASSLFYAVLLTPYAVQAQGSLTPPGAPAPTMKSLEQIASTGIAVNATNTPGGVSEPWAWTAHGASSAA